MSDEININNNEQLEVIVEKIEKKIIAKYKNKFIGLIVGVSVALSIITYFGIGNIQKSLTEKVTKKLINDKFKNEVSKDISKSLSKPTSEIINQMKENKAITDSILKEIQSEHDDVIKAATNEFKRTIEVLRKVREKHSTSN